MIILTRLGNGMPIAVNPDLIERAEPTPDTVVTLVDGHKLLVEEPVDEVVAMIRTWRAQVAAEALLLTRVAGEDDAVPHGTGPHGTGPHAYDEPRDLHAGHARDAVAGDRAAHTSALGRVLRMPAREV